jgi:unsaturated rhamnogalacturonyl hydrolase
MTDLRTLRETSRLAANRLISHPWKLWFWGDSIGLEGLLDATELTGDPIYASFVYGLLKGWLPRESARSPFDYTAPGVALLRVYEKTGDVALLSAAYRHAEYMAAFRRTTAGAYVRYENAAIELPPELPKGHPASTESDPSREMARNGGPCVFVDSVHFDGPFFAKLYQVTGNEDYRALALENILPQVELLYDQREFLFHHFWIEQTQRPNGVLWARGNGWGLLGVVQTLGCTGVDAPDSRPLIEVLTASLPRLKQLQDASGAWHTILNDPGSYVESSTAAFFADIICRAIQLGIVRREEYWDVIERAIDFLLRNVNNDGLLDGVSYETFPSIRAEHYRQMPRGSMSPWGQGPLLAAALSYAEAVQVSEKSLPRIEEEARAIG